MTTPSTTWQLAQAEWQKIVELHDLHPELMEGHNLSVCMFPGVTQLSISLFGKPEILKAFARAHQDAGWKRRQSDWKGVWNGIQIHLHDVDGKRVEDDMPVSFEPIPEHFPA